MQIHPLVTVKKAANVLGLDKAIIRSMLDNGVIKGERRVVGNKEKWFLYQGEVQDLLDRRIPELVKEAERTTLNGLSDFFDPAAESPTEQLLDQSVAGSIADHSVVRSLLDDSISESILDEFVAGSFVDDFVAGSILDQSVAGAILDDSIAGSIQNESVDGSIANDFVAGSIAAESLVVTEVGDHELDNPDRMQLQTEQLSVDQLLHSLTIEFAHRLCDERQLILNLQRHLAEKNLLLQSIPDLNQKLDEDKLVLQNKDAEITLLKANISALETDLTWWKKPWWNRMFAGAVKG